MLPGKFILRLAGFSLLIAIVLQLLLSTKSWFSTDVWGAFTFFVLLTLVIHLLSVRALAMSSVKNSMSIIFGTLFFRLFASFGYLIIYLVVTGKKDVPYTITFLILYLLFTIFEIYHLVTNLRPDSKK